MIDDLLPDELNDDDGIFAPTNHPVVIENRKCIIKKKGYNYEYQRRNRKDQ